MEPHVKESMIVIAMIPAMAATMEPAMVAVGCNQPEAVDCKPETVDCKPEVADCKGNRLNNNYMDIFVLEDTALHFFDLDVLVLVVLQT